jgi:hypothetical protein
LIQLDALFRAEVLGEKSEDLPLCACHRFGT